jgi:hypothetical protein
VLPDREAAELERILDEHGLAGAARDRIRFVHGTVEDADFADGIDPTRGKGELGQGFYAFIASGAYAQDGQYRALKRAEIKASRVGLKPMLVYTEMPTSAFLALERVEVTVENYMDYVNPARAGRVLGIPITWGLVFRNGYELCFPDGQPKQYKFEAEAVGRLTIVKMEVVAR